MFMFFQKSEKKVLHFLAANVREYSGSMNCENRATRSSSLSSTYSTLRPRTAEKMAATCFEESE